MCSQSDDPSMTEPRALCSAIWNGCRCDRRRHEGDGHVWRNTLDGDLVDPALYPAARQSLDVEAARREVGKRLTDARIDELMRAAAIPLHGRPVDLQARYVAAEIRADVLEILARLGTHGPIPDHRMCQCGHTGSVHDAARNAPVTPLGYSVEGYGRCHGRTDGGKRCACLDFTAKDATHATDAQPLDVEALLRDMPGYYSGTTIDGDDVTTGMVESDDHTSWQGEWVQKGVILARLNAKDAEPCQRPVEPASVGLDWCSVHGGRWRFGDTRCGLARLTAKDAE